MTAISDKGTAIEKGYRMSPRDIICREVIQEIMCNQHVDLVQVAADYSLSLSELHSTLGFTEASLQPFIEDKLLIFDLGKLTVLPEGRLFLRNIAMLFDPLHTVGKEVQYSKTV